MEYIIVTSRKNDSIIWANKLKDKKYRDRENLFFIEGRKLLEEVLEANLKIKKLYFTSKALDNCGELLENSNAEECFLVSDEVYEKLTEESAPQGIFACVEKFEIPKAEDFDLSDGGYIILEDIQNPLNLGAIIRCSYSLGGVRIILTKGCCDVFNPKALRGAMGSIFKTQFLMTDNLPILIKTMKNNGNRVICTSLHTDSHILGKFSFKDSDSIVIGSEGRGISQEVLEVCGESIIIPMVENAESLNAATALSVLVWEMKKSTLLNKS